MAVFQKRGYRPFFFFFFLKFVYIIAAIETYGYKQHYIRIFYKCDYRKSLKKKKKKIYWTYSRVL